MNTFVKKFSEIGIGDIAMVGGKNASLGEMYSKLSAQGIPVPDGFAVTAFAFESYLTSNAFHSALFEILRQLDRKTFSNLKETGKQARELLLSGTIPEEIKLSILKAYRELTDGETQGVAVRSSATAEDLPQASFAGQHESYLNVKGEEALLQAVKQCYASLYTDRAIKYREDNGFAHQRVDLSVGIQKMVRADKACSGVAFTLEPESGFRDVIHISGLWGLGENLVQGTVTPDEFLLFKPTLQQGKNAIIQKTLGEKEKTMIYSEEAAGTIVNIATPIDKQEQYVLSDEEVTQLAKWALIIESHYAKPMDIEWAKDGFNGELFIIQARPETVHSMRNPLCIEEYKLKDKGRMIVSGEAIGSKITTGVARILQSPADAGKLQPGDIVVTDLTSPDWDPVLKNAGAILTNKGGRTSHASIVAREIGVPAIVGCGNATTLIKEGELITV